MRELEPALTALERSLTLDAGNLQAALAMIAVLCEAGQPSAALARCKDLLSLHPANAQLHFNTGLVYEAIGDLPSALQHYDRALDAGSLDALQNRAVVLTRLGRHDEAIGSNQRLIAACPRSADAHYNLAESCLAARRFDEAVAAADRALEIDPSHVLARLDRCLAFAASGRLEDAREDLQAVVSSGDARLRERIDKWLADSGLVDRFDAAVVFEPESVFLLMGCERRERCEWENAAAFVTRCVDMVSAAPPGRLQFYGLAFKLLHVPLPASVQRIVADRIADGLTRRFPARKRPEAIRRSAAKRLRVAYLSADFGCHAVGFLTRSMYRLHDRERFEIFGYALSEDDGSDNFHMIREGCDTFSDVRALPAEQLGARIAADSIDILVDLNGYTRNGRSHVLALRPAPVQVNYLGYPSTLGGTLADYFVGDAVASPSSLAPFFAEKIVHLPHCYIPTSHRAFSAPPRPTRRDEGLPEGGTVFCALHRHEKIDPVAFAAWMRILHAVPQSVLWLQQGPGEANLRRHARDAGIDPVRLIFAPHRPHAQHLARQRLADLFLDTRVWNAHTTGADALWCGVPIVTYAGEHTVSRLGASLLHGIGLDELIADTFERYEAMAIDLATDPGKLAGVKARLARNRETHPLFDIVRLVRNLERAYLEMWRIHESGEPPRAFSIEEPPAGRG